MNLTDLNHLSRSNHTFERQNLFDLYRKGTQYTIFTRKK